MEGLTISTIDLHPGIKNQKRIRVGTSGYSYSWNKGRPSPFEWYLSLGFNTVEINSTFYRFPEESWINLWASKSPRDFDFEIKVHRSVTHFSKLRKSAIPVWKKFHKVLTKDKRMKAKISFWLFQLPSSYKYSDENLSVLIDFFRKIDLGNSAVIEFREPEWWKCKRQVTKETGAVFCSVDSPDLPREIVALNDVVYLRLHGRESWYSYVYKEEELKALARKVRESQASRCYVLLNNDHGMLPNGRYLMEVLALKGMQVP